MQASRMDKTSSSTFREALPMSLIFRARKSMDLTCSTMTNPVRPGSNHKTLIAMAPAMTIKADSRRSRLICSPRK